MSGKLPDALRPPAVPLVAHDPYFSIWSAADRLTDAPTTHWTGKPQPLSSVIRVDGNLFRLMGVEPVDAPAMPQQSVQVLPTRTIYRFGNPQVNLALTFLTPALPANLDVLSRPLTYLTWEVSSADGKPHAVQIDFGISGLLAIDMPQQEVAWDRPSIDGLVVSRVGSKSQRVLARKGDDLRIDWGYAYVAAPAESRTHVAGDGLLRFDLGTVAAAPAACHAMVAYDDLYSIQYMNQNLRPYWRRNGWEAADLLQAAAKDRPALLEQCVAFDDSLMADVARAGGEHYAQLCALAYRQCFAAGKFVADANGQPLQFSKENHSNGCIATSDVFYPMAPQFLLFGPTLTKSFLVPFMDYAASARWKFPFAPHDLGTYPKANGQVYGGGERSEHNQMPVEENGNLILLFCALAQMEGNATFAGLYWPLLEKWAEYLKEKGFDPENQLCTDDFAGHLAHNVNLSAKAICALGAFAKLCEMRGDAAKAADFQRIAQEFAARWVKEADDGDRYRLAFDKPGSWSQKYNLVWDRILGLNLFPPEVARKELEHYRKIQNTYGLPLDNRKTYTKLDWITWTATLTQNRDDFEALVAPVFRFMNETPERSPLTDWYETTNARKVGFTARPVVGGVFLRMLYDQDVWRKYASSDTTKASGWAPMPSRDAHDVTEIVPTARKAPVVWRYTLDKPADHWTSPDFDDSGWKEAPAGFGAAGTPNAVVRTEWKGKAIWLRRVCELEDPAPVNPSLIAHFDEDATVYLNGVVAAELPGWSDNYENVPIEPPAIAALRGGRNVLAVHCQQKFGGQFIDVGLAVESTKAPKP